MSHSTLRVQGAAAQPEKTKGLRSFRKRKNKRKGDRIYMFQLDLKSRKSIYEQIVDNFKELIISGILAEDEKLPSVRELSASLTVNPNTAQKAYRELERQGYLYVVPGLGTFVAKQGAREIDQAYLSETKGKISAALKELTYMGLSRDEIKKILEELLTEGGDAK